MRARGEVRGQGGPHTTRAPGWAPFTHPPPTKGHTQSLPWSRCYILENDTVQCDLDLYKSLQAWKDHKLHIDHEVMGVWAGRFLTTVSLGRAPGLSGRQGGRPREGGFTASSTRASGFGPSLRQTAPAWGEESTATLHPFLF